MTDIDIVELNRTEHAWALALIASRPLRPSAVESIKRLCESVAKTLCESREESPGSEEAGVEAAISRQH